MTSNIKKLHVWASFETLRKVFLLGANETHVLFNKNFFTLFIWTNCYMPKHFLYRYQTYFFMTWVIKLFGPFFNIFLFLFHYQYFQKKLFKHFFSFFLFSLIRKNNIFKLLISMKFPSMYIHFVIFSLEITPLNETSESSFSYKKVSLLRKFKLG